MSGSTHRPKAREPEDAPKRGQVVVRWNKQRKRWIVRGLGFERFEDALKAAGPRNFVDSGPERMTHEAPAVAAAEDEDEAA